VGPVSRMRPEPAVAVIVRLSQVPMRPLGVATTSPAGSVSVKATPVRLVLGLGLVMVNDSDVVPLSGMLAAPKALVMVGLLGGGAGMSARAASAPDIFPIACSVQVIVVEP